MLYHNPTNTHTRTHAHTHTHTQTQTHARTHTHIRARTHPHTSARTNTHTQINYIHYTLVWDDSGKSLNVEYNLRSWRQIVIFGWASSFKKYTSFFFSTIWNSLTYEISTSIQHCKWQYVRWTHPSFLLSTLNVHASIPRVSAEYTLLLS